eukprot:8202513-Pyramimonas_sp.AAC.1
MVVPPSPHVRPPDVATWRAVRLRLALAEVFLWAQRGDLVVLLVQGVVLALRRWRLPLHLHLGWAAARQGGGSGETTGDAIMPGTCS